MENIKTPALLWLAIQLVKIQDIFEIITYRWQSWKLPRCEQICREILKIHTKCWPFKKKTKVDSGNAVTFVNFSMAEAMAEPDISPTLVSVASGSIHKRKSPFRKLRTEGKPLTHRSSGRRMFIEDVLFHVVDLNLHFRVRFPNIMFWQSQQTSWQVFTIHYVIYTSNISKLNLYQWRDIIFCTFIFPAAWDPALQCCLQVNVTISTGGSPVGGWA